MAKSKEEKTNVMRFKEEGDSVISMALTEHEESEE